MNWYKLSQNTANVTVNLGDFPQQLEERILSYAENQRAENERLANYQFNPESAISQLSAVGYPNVAQIQSAIQSKDQQQLHNAIMAIYQWERQTSRANKDYSLWQKIRVPTKTIQDYADHLAGPTEVDDQKMLAEVNQIVSQTKQNFDAFANTVRQAISHIPSWHGSAVTISFRGIDKDYNYTPLNEFHVELTLGKGAWGGTPSFTVFTGEGKYEVDDIIESGDDDFFNTSESQQDYFNLISEIKSPGSTAGKGNRILTLFTARPVKDRKQYLDAKEVPANIYMTNNANMAMSWDKEFTTVGPRDVWKVKIDSRYLMQTLDTPTDKEYQVTQIAPVQSIILFDRGDDRIASNWYKNYKFNV